MTDMTVIQIADGDFVEIVNELVFIGWQDMPVEEMPTFKGEEDDHQAI